MHPLDLTAFPIRLIAGLAAAAFVWFVVAQAGYRIVRPAATDRLAAAALGAAFGYAGLGTIVALLGALHAIKAWLLFGAVLAIAIVSIPSYVRLAAQLPAHWRVLQSWYRSIGVLSRLALGVCAFALVTGAGAAALPAVWWDPLAYHLPIAAKALAGGTFGVDLGMVQSAWPSLGEACALPAYAAAGTAGAAMSMLFAGVVLALICALLAERFAPESGPLAAALVMSCALWLWLAPSSYVDVQFALFAVAAIAAPFFASRQNGLAAGLLCGAFTGAAAATKFAGLPFAVIALGVALLVGPPRRGRVILGFIAGAIAIAIGWYARDYFATGDPLYPFLTAMHKAHVSVASFSGVNANWERRWCGGGTSLADLATLPWRLLTEPRAFCGDFGYALRLGIVFALVCLLRVRATWPIALAGAAVTLYWFALAQELRFLVPAVALVAVLAAVGTAAVPSFLGGFGRAMLLVLGALTVLENWLPWTISDSTNSLVPGYAYIAGREDGAAYVHRRLETFGAAQWLVAHSATKNEVIALDDIRTYYFWGGIAWANPAYQSVWSIDWAVLPERRYNALRDHGFRYLVVNATPAYVHRTPTGVQWEQLAGDVSSGVLRPVFNERDVSIYEIVPKARTSGQM